MKNSVKNVKKNYLGKMQLFVNTVILPASNGYQVSILFCSGGLTYNFSKDEDAVILFLQQKALYIIAIEYFFSIKRMCQKSLSGVKHKLQQ